MPANRKPLGKAADATKKPARPGHGGPRAGAGRPSNSSTKRSKAAADRISAGIVVVENEYGELPPEATPLDVMILAMRAEYKRAGPVAAHPYARDAAPYLHARIAQMELKNPEGKAFTVAFRWQGEE